MSTRVRPDTQGNLWIWTKDTAVGTYLKELPFRRRQWCERLCAWRVDTDLSNRVKRGLRQVAFHPVVIEPVTEDVPTAARAALERCLVATSPLDLEQMLDYEAAERDPKQNTFVIGKKAYNHPIGRSGYLEVLNRMGSFALADWPELEELTGDEPA